jgi:CheY-like chemotaxis protein/anti-sigma regulatory factor (Ser/Thr protein kinase)
MKRILVVDDEAVLRELYSEILGGAGYEITTAADGMEALERLDQQEFDLVLMDIWMPRLNGLEVLSRLRERHTHARVIITTGDQTPGSLLTAIREQAYRYLLKPCSPQQLLEAVRGAIEASGAPPPIEIISAQPAWVELLVPCELDAAERIQEFLMHLKADLPREVRERVGQAFRELLLNAIEWGGEFDPNRKVRIAYVRGRRLLLYRIADPGQGFRVEELEHAAIGHPPGEVLEHVAVREEKGLRPGGFGILMAQAMVDEIIYNEARNEVLLIKYLDSQPPSKNRGG